MPRSPAACLGLLAATTLALAFGWSGCATAPRPVSKIVNGRVVVTRAISPAAYDHVARALLYEEEQRWDEAALELQRALPFDDEAAEVRAHLADLFVRLGRLDDAADQIQRSLAIAATVEGYAAAAHLADARHDEKGALKHYQAAAATALTDENADAIERTHVALTEAQLAVLDVAGAYETIRRLRQVSPDSVRARIDLAALAWALGRIPEAEAALAEALRLEPAVLDARLMKAAIMVATGKIPQAKAGFREALERSEDSIEIAEMFLKWLVARGDTVEAAAEADRLTPDIIDDSTVETVIRLERAAARPERAKAAADQAVKKGARPERVALLVASALIDAKDHPGAAARLLQIPRDTSKPTAVFEFIESRLRAAEALREDGRPAQLERASRALDEAAGAIANAARAATAKTPAAATPAAPAAPGTPASVPVAGSPAGSTATTGAATEIWAVDLGIARALLDEKRGDAVRAARGMDTLLKKDPTQPRLLMVRAAIEERRGEWRSALALTEKILAVDPRHVEALNFHGFVSVDHDNDLPTATRRLQVAMALNPGAGGIVDSLGWAYLHAGDLPRAAEFLAQADRLEPGDPEILTHLAELFVKQKDPTRAIATYRRALERDPSARLAREITARLQSLESKSAAGR